MESRQSIAERILADSFGCPSTLSAEGGFAQCPGIASHTKNTGPKDFRVVLDGAPTGFCFHSGCSAAVEDFNKQLRRGIWIAEHGESAPPRNHWNAPAPEPKRAAPAARPHLDLEKIRQFTASSPEISEAWITKRSPIDPDTVSPEDFLAHLYYDDERILILTTHTFCPALLHGATNREGIQRSGLPHANSLACNGPASTINPATTRNES